MTIQTVELAGRRFVIIPEDEFQKLTKDAGTNDSGQPQRTRQPSQFAQVTPLKIAGIPASELLIQDRR